MKTRSRYSRLAKACLRSFELLLARILAVGRTRAHRRRRARRRGRAAQERSRSKTPLTSTPIASPSPHALAVAVLQNAKTVVLDLVDPLGTGRWLFRRFWHTRLDGFYVRRRSGTSCAFSREHLPMVCPDAFSGQIWASDFAVKCLISLPRPKRFELLTPRFVVWCSINDLGADATPANSRASPRTITPPAATENGRGCHIAGTIRPADR
jgi:hypothetical protein